MRKASILLAALAIVQAPAAQDPFDLTVVRDYYFTFAQANWWNLLQQGLSTGTPVKGDLIVDGVVYQDIGLRVKGASSSSFPGVKKPFNLEMDAFVAGQNLYGSTTLNLNNGALDPTLTRETISYRIFRDYLPSPQAAYCRVHLNGTYWGCYILVEQPNKAMLRRWFRDEDGGRYKGDRPSGAAVGTSPLTWLGTSVSNYQSRYEIKTPTHPNAWTDLIGMIDRLNNAPTSTFKAEIEQLVDVDRAIWYFVMMNLVVNSDDYVGAGHNYYMYFDPDDGRMSLVPWDLNEAFGTHGPSNNPWQYSPTNNFSATSRPLARRLMAVPEWRELYYAHYRTAIRQWLDWENVLEPLNSQYQSLILSSVQSDPNYLYPMSRFGPSFSGRFFSQFHYIWGLKEVIVNRKAYLAQNTNLTKSEPQIDQVTLLTPTPRSGDIVWVTARVGGTPSMRDVALRWGSRGPFQSSTMFDDGAHNDGLPNDGIWGGSFVAGAGLTTVRYYVHATNTAGTVQVEPKNAELAFFTVDVEPGNPAGPVIINELVADNETGDVDEFGEFEDWFELHNTGAQVYDVGGHYVTDDPFAPRKWQIPANTPIQPGGFLRIWADGEPTEGPMHTTFKLSKSGETVALYDTEARGNSLLDGVRFAQQKGDRAYGRVPDAGTDWFYVWDPTGAAPLLAPGGFTRYDGRRTGSPNDFDLRGSGVAAGGNVFRFDISGGAASSNAALLLGIAPLKLALPPFGTLGVNLGGAVLLPVTLDPLGAVSIPVTVPTGVAGVVLYSQAIHQDLSNALTIQFQ